MSGHLRQWQFALWCTSGITLLAANTSWGAVAGRVSDAGGSVLAGAKVEIWSDYPAGSILASGTANGMGEFSFGSVSGASFDLRVRKDGYFPTVVRDLPNPIANTSVRLQATPLVAGNPNLCDYYHLSSTFLGAPIALGDVVEVVAQSGLTRGSAGAVVEGGWLVHAAGDDPATPAVDGPVPGEQMSFKINGLASTLNNAPVTFQPYGNAEASLTGSAIVPGVTLTAPATVEGHMAGSATIIVHVVNTGSVSGAFLVDVSLNQPWSVVIQSAAGLNLNLAPGESSDVVAQINIPAGTPEMSVDVLSRVTSQTYAAANSGGWTDLSVTTVTGIDDENGSNLPQSFRLSQNFPNPFNSGTRITFDLETGGYTRLTICNLLGQTVRTLVDEFRGPGSYDVAWDGRDDRGAAMASGVYFSLLGHQELAQVRTMVLLK